MTSLDSIRNRVRPGAVVGAAATLAAVSVLAAAAGASGTAARGQPDFGAAARIAVGQAAAGLAPRSGIPGPATSR